MDEENILLAELAGFKVNRHTGNILDENGEWVEGIEYNGQMIYSGGEPEIEKQWKENIEYLGDDYEGDKKHTRVAYDAAEKRLQEYAKNPVGTQLKND